MGLPRQEYWSGLPCPSPGDLLNPGIEPRPLALQSDSLLSEPPGEPMKGIKVLKFVLLKDCLPVEKESEVEGQQADSGPSGLVRKLGWGWGAKTFSGRRGWGHLRSTPGVHGSCTGPARHPTPLRAHSVMEG